MPQPVADMTYESVIDAANPGYPWEPPMANAAVPVGAGVLAYQPRLHPPSGAAVAYPVPGNPTDPYPSGGGGPALVSVALNAAGSWPGRIDFKVTTGPSAVAIAAYLGAPGVALNKATMPRYRCTVPPSATDAVVTIGDPSIVNVAAQNATLGRQWSKAGAQYIHANTDPSNKVAVSDDGINWECWSAPNDNQGWEGIAWSPELSRFCAIASVGGTPSTARAMTSPDGINWTVNILGTAAHREVCWGGPPGGQLFVTAVNTAGGLFTSPTGLSSTWTSRTKPVALFTNNVCWGGPPANKFVAVGEGIVGNRAIYSSDGITWLAAVTPAVDLNWRAVVWSPEKALFVAAAASGAGTTADGRVMTSPDGINWTQRPLDTNLNTTSWQWVTWSPQLGIFVASGTVVGASPRIMTSPDGINWTARMDTGPSTGTVLNTAWSPELGLFVGITSSGSPRFMTSPDGITWTDRPNSPAGNGWHGLTYSPALRRFVAVGTNMGVNFERVYWKGIPSRIGEIWRIGINVEALTIASSNAGAGFANPVSSGLSPSISSTGLKLWRYTAVADNEWVYIHNTTDATSTMSDVIFYKETPNALPQGLYDVHVCHVDANGVEGAITKFSNVNVV